MIEKIDAKFFDVPTWRNFHGLVHYKAVTGDHDNRFCLVYTLDPSNLRHQEILKEIPYQSIKGLDEKIYGKGLYIAERYNLPGSKKVYDILVKEEKEGVVIGRFTRDITEDIIRGGLKGGYRLYYGTDGSMMPREHYGDPKETSLDDAIVSYCSDKPEVLKHITLDVMKKNPKLLGRLMQAPKPETKTPKTNDGEGKK